VVSSGWSFVSAVPGQITYLVATLNDIWLPFSDIGWLIIVTVVIVAVILVVVVVGGVSFIIKLSFVYNPLKVVSFPSILLGNASMNSFQGVPVGSVFLLGLLVPAIVAACASRVAKTLSATSFLMAA
ncbi:hypothetical protein Tco_0442142, partial [Tanacetum coccineum]